MFNQNKKKYLLAIGTIFQKKGFKVIFKDKSIINDSYLALTIINNRQYTQIKIKRDIFHFFKEPQISIMYSEIQFLDEIKRANFEVKKEIDQLGPKKNKIYEGLNFIFVNLKKHTPNIEIHISDFKSNPDYEDILSFYEFILPAHGIFINNEDITPLFGLAVGGSRAGGILLCNPITKKIKLDSYIGFGTLGKPDPHKLDLYNGNKLVIEQNGSLGKFSSNSSPDTD